MPDFQVLINGSPITGKVVLNGNSFDNRQCTIVHNSGSAAAGKLVQIGTSCIINLSAITGNLNNSGQFVFVVGPSFGGKGDVTLTVSVGVKNKTLDFQFV